jgi:hypothetical protein
MRGFHNGEMEREQEPALEPETGAQNDKEIL